MQIVKLNATDSTNLYLKNLILSTSPKDYTVVVAETQLKGRGQMGTTWESEAGKNLTFSVLKRIVGVSVSDQFRLNQCVSLAIYETLWQLQVPDLSIKWPNDILSGRSKVCGILIENILSGNKLQASIIGIGLNVNQMEFNNLPNVSSLKRLLGQSLNLEELLRSIIDNLKRQFTSLTKEFDQSLGKTYEEKLFRKDKPSSFKNKQDELFMGFIRGVSPEGKLIVALEDNLIKEFDLKEIKLLY